MGETIHFPISSERFHFERYYLHQSGQALHVVAKVQSSLWGKCLLVELTTPFSMGRVIPIWQDANAKGWAEITKEEFEKQINQHTEEFVALQKAGTRKERIKSWVRNLFGKKSGQAASPVSQSTSVNPEPFA